MPRTHNRERRPSRARIILGIVIVLLLLLLSVLGVYFVRVLTPLQRQTTETVDLNGLVWVRSLYGFGPSEAEQLASPTSVAFAPNGEIYVTDPQYSRVMIFDPDGTFSRLLHTGAGGTEKGMFSRPESIDVDENGDVYIADSFSSKVIVFNSEGRFLREWIMPNPGEEAARGIYVADGKVYVLTVGHLRVFDTKGRELGNMGSRGRKPGQIDAYQGVVADGKQIYIADALNRRVMALDNKGKSLWITPRDEKDSMESDAPYQLPQDVCFDGAGRLVTIDGFKFTLIVSDPQTGDVIASYGADGTGEGQFMYPSSVDYDPDRDWFAVADTRNNRVQLVRLPDSGGNAQSAIRRALSSPYRYCAIPLILLIIVAIVAYVTSRRARRADERDEGGYIESPEGESTEHQET